MENRRRSSVAEPEAERLQTMKNRRKSSVNQAALDRALAVKVAMVEGKELNEADRKLAEMGYQQVGQPVSARGVSADLDTGLQKRIFVDILYILCAVRVRIPSDKHPTPFY
jgi:hypothetical protein